MNWEMVIGLEVHIQLNTKSKLFSSSSTEYGQHQNTQASFLDLGLPGTLPVINKKAIDKAIIFGLSVNAKISKNSFFARKNYFYPDLPKGYQITQSSNPIIQEGKLQINTSKGIKVIRIERAHLEEDAGKSIHGYISNHTGLDYNRAGIPLLEIVTYPDFRSGEEVIIFLKKLHQIVKHLNICDGNMQEGSFRCDVNLSIKEKRETKFGTRVELKNLNSFKFIKKAIAYEYSRQINLLESQIKVVQETRLYDAHHNVTRSMRLKENMFDYRYFPDPDLLPLLITDDYIKEVKKKMPINLEERKALYLKYLNDQEVEYLLSNIEIFNYYEKIAIVIGYKTAYNWVINLISILNKINKKFDTYIVPTEILLEIITNVKRDVISYTNSSIVISEYINSKNSIQSIIKNLNLEQISNDNEILKLVKNIIIDNPKQVNEFKKNNKTKLISFFVGQVIKKSQDKLNPKQINKIVLEELNKI